MSSLIARAGSLEPSALALLLAVAGCGGKADRGRRRASSIAEPRTSASARRLGRGPPPDGPATATAADAEPPAPPRDARRRRSRPRAGARSRARSSSTATRPPPKVLVAKGKAAPRTPRSAPRSADQVRAAGRRPGDQGGQERHRLHPQADRGEPRGQDGRAAAAGRLRPEECVFEPHVLGRDDRRDGRRSSRATRSATTSTARLKNNTFNEPIAAGDDAGRSTRLAPSGSPGEVTCDIHPWMKAYWLVLDNPYFAVTDDKGNFEIKNVPAGTQKVVVWQEADAFVTPTSGQDVTIAANGDTTQDFTIPASKVINL